MDIILLYISSAKILINEKREILTKSNENHRLQNHQQKLLINERKKLQFQDILENHMRMKRLKVILYSIDIEN